MVWSQVEFFAAREKRQGTSFQLRLVENNDCFEIHINKAIFRSSTYANTGVILGLIAQNHLFEVPVVHVIKRRGNGQAVLKNAQAGSFHQILQLQLYHEDRSAVCVLLEVARLQEMNIFLVFFCQLQFFILQQRNGDSRVGGVDKHNVSHWNYIWILSLAYLFADAFFQVAERVILAKISGNDRINRLVFNFIPFEAAFDFV